MPKENKKLNKVLTALYSGSIVVGTVAGILLSPVLGTVKQAITEVRTGHALWKTRKEFMNQVLETVEEDIIEEEPSTANA